MSGNKTINAISAIQSFCKENHISEYSVAIKETYFKGDECDRIVFTSYVPRPDRAYEKREAKREAKRVESLENCDVEEKCTESPAEKS